MVKKQKLPRPVSNRRKPQNAAQAVLDQCVIVDAPQPVRIDIGCGQRKQPGFYGIDAIGFNGVDLVYDLRRPWPFVDSSVQEIWCSHFLEHFDSSERAHMVNEAYRVLSPGGKMTVICPYGFSERAYGDPTHKWPPVVGFWFFYLKRAWRNIEAPHCNEIYSCDFEVTWGYMMHPEFSMKNMETQQFASQWYTNAIMDIQAVMTKPAAGTADASYLTPSSTVH
jgi:ubiquinone/menaquinone biosynthesis C-methylase UbiE